jgi:hypothetical protein
MPTVKEEWSITASEVVGCCLLVVVEEVCPDMKQIFNISDIISNLNCKKVLFISLSKYPT